MRGFYIIAEVTKKLQILLSVSNIAVI